MPTSTSSSVAPSIRESKQDDAESPSIDTYKRAVFVKSPEKDEVAVVDMRDVEWWTIVNPESLEENRSMDEEASELGDSFAVVKEDDVVESMANYVAVSIERNADARKLSPAEMKKVIDGTFAQMKKQGALSQAYGWGMWLYSSYSWGSYIVRIYREPVLVKLLFNATCILYSQPFLIPVFAKGLWSATSWAIVSYFA